MIKSPSGSGNIKLYAEIRKKLESGMMVQDLILKFLAKGYSRSEIDFAVAEFYKDESTDSDDKLIRQIEIRFKKGEYMQDVMEDLVKEGHKPFEVEKAIIRASTTPDTSLNIMFTGWRFYTYIQLLILGLTIILAIFYTPIFAAATVFMFSEMIAAYLLIPQKNKKWNAEVTVLPYAGLTVTQGWWGYNSTIGNYFRWWVIDPAIVLAAFFIIFGFYGAQIYGINFLIINLLLGMFSSLSFFAKRN
ncbi:hypothetical protein K9M79_07580 [Candidatus Woesearchaeota archaeon]|nr:hypothetical protein [Candidatus Woesearchaeota archaeon]